MKDIAAGKPLKLTTISNGNAVYDTLHLRPQTEGVCNRHVCNGSLMLPKKSSTELRSKEEVLKLAKDFIDEYYHSIKSEQHRSRWEAIRGEIEAKGTYELSQTELVYGAKLAWRNAPRCIGRIQWSKLQVFDARYVTTASGMFEALCKHIKYGTNKGNLRSAITIFPQRTDGKRDFRIWNAQLISYAGYKNSDESITGDPVTLEFTEVCLRLGWKGKGGRFDILPLVLSAQGEDPEWFEIPPELILEVDFSHPEFKWFEGLGLKWYAFPAVASLMFDCGGLEFPSAPFNGWYMETEIGARDLCDPFRYNVMEDVGKAMGIDTTSNTNLWKDRVLVEVNLAVLYSFQSKNITIVDHHSAAESFMKHFENEHRLRGGCPADWVWIVPPISGSATPVFHQEMSMYYMKPSYEYQEAAWKTHVWTKKKEACRGSGRKTTKKFKFAEIARAVKFTSKLFSKALSKRIKATILYATETGKSESYAQKLGEIFGHTFNAQVYCMMDYDIINLEHEALVIVVTSTFGNGDPPENGEEFAKNLYAMKMSGTAADIENVAESLPQSKSFMRMNSQTEPITPMTPQDSFSSGNFSGFMSGDNMGPLSNVRYAVFALGSSAYPNFCAFGKYADNLLGELGAEQLLVLTCGDELSGQEQTFKEWATDVFRVSCETFCLDDEAALLEATAVLKTESAICKEKVKFANADKEQPIASGLSRAHGKKVKSCEIIIVRNLHGEKASRWTEQVIFKADTSKEMQYQPGDHVAILPANRSKLVNLILPHLEALENPDQPIQVLLLKELHTLNGLVYSWEPHDRLPEASVRTLLTRYIDLTTPPTQNLLHLLSEHADDTGHKERLQHLVTNLHDYEDWKHRKYPNLAEVLEEFNSIKIEAPLLLTKLPLMQARFYSISSSPLVHAGEIHLTVAIVLYKTEGGKGPLHFGVCSNYLKDIKPGEHIQCYVRSASSFHLPKDKTKPVILVGPGTGIAPFRSFWHHWNYLHTHNEETLGSMTLFFGCRTRALELYKEEKEEMRKKGILTNNYLALSREISIPKTYVQDLLVKVGADIYEQIVRKSGHFYVCGDCTMAECVYQRLKLIIQEHGRLTEQQVETYMLQMRDENRYHEDIFGITLRTEEVHRQTRETAKMRMNFVTQSTISFSQDEIKFL